MRVERNIVWLKRLLINEHGAKLKLDGQLKKSECGDSLRKSLRKKLIPEI